ncbi:MAG: aminoglycoside adenylyltransferase domain-containing protein [Gaiellaceae bacterium]
MVEELQRILGDDLIGVYLQGSAVLGCFGPNSDIDLVAISRRSLDAERRLRLAKTLLGISAPYEPPGPPRPIELDLVLDTALHPWRYPTPLDFHYSEEFRARFKAGEHEAWEGLESRALAAHITVLRQAGVAIAGPPIESVFPEVLWSDYVHALTHDLDWCRDHFAKFPRYGVLSIARIWATLATQAPQSKASGAEWALPRLPADLRPVLEHGLDVYTGATEEHWSDLPVADYISAVATEIETLTQR